MITKVCIDNFRCFQNFELELGPLCLLLGDNGSGKSTFVDAIMRVCKVVNGERPVDCFSASDLTAWYNGPFQNFVVEMRFGDDQYRYELTIGHAFPANNRWIEGERLLWNSRLVYESRNGQVQLYRQSGADVTPYTTFPFNSSQSFLPLVEEPAGANPLGRFRDALLGKWVPLRLVPPLMEPFSKDESPRLLPDGRNFSSWYRYLAQVHPEVVSDVTESLRDVIRGFQHLRFSVIGESKLMEVSFVGVAEAIPFHQLSDGQRALIVLHTVLHTARRLGQDLAIDEPDNYLSMREIQPWLHGLEDLCLEKGRQAILVSHHPEIINPLAQTNGIFFTRPDNGPARAHPGYPIVEGLTAAETMARGWDDEHK